MPSFWEQWLFSKHQSKKLRENYTECYKESKRNQTDSKPLSPKHNQTKTKEKGRKKVSFMVLRPRNNHRLQLCVCMCVCRVYVYFNTVKIILYMKFYFLVTYHVVRFPQSLKSLWKHRKWLSSSVLFSCKEEGFPYSWHHSTTQISTFPEVS